MARSGSAERVPDAKTRLSPPGDEGLVQFLDFRTGRGLGSSHWILTDLESGSKAERTADHDGRTTLPAGAWSVEASAEDLVVRPDSFDLAVGAAVNLLVFREEALRVQVVEAVSGHGIPGATVLWEPPFEFEDHQAAGTYAYPTRTTDQDGFADFSGLPALSAGRVSAMAMGYQPLRVQIPDAGVASAPRGGSAELRIPLSSGAAPLVLSFADHEGDPRVGVLVRAKVWFDERPWAGGDIAYVGRSDPNGDVPLYGVYREVKHFLADGKGWPMEIAGIAPPVERAQVVIPDVLHGHLRVSGLDKSDLEVHTSVEGEFSKAGEERQARCARVTARGTLDLAGQIAATLPRSSPSMIVVTLSDGRRRILRDVRMESEPWEIEVSFADDDPSHVEVVSRDEPIAVIEVSADEPGGSFDIQAPAGGVQHFRVPLRESIRTLFVRSTSGKSVAVTDKGDVGTRPKESVVEIEFSEATERSFTLRDGSGDPLANHRIQLVESFRPGDAASGEFGERRTPDGRWSIRRGNAFEATTDGQGQCRIALPSETYRVWVRAPAWRTPLLDMLPLVPAGRNEISLRDGVEQVDLVAERHRRVLLDVSELRRSGALADRWFVRAESIGRSLGCEGDWAELDVPGAGVLLDVTTEEGEVVRSIEVPPGEGVWEVALED